MTPGSELAGICCKAALKIPSNIARGSRESRDEIGVARGERIIARERGLRGRRPWGRESQLVEAFTKSVLECHGGQIVRDGEHTGLISSASHNESAVSLYQNRVDGARLKKEEMRRSSSFGAIASKAKGRG